MVPYVLMPRRAQPIVGPVEGANRQNPGGVASAESPRIPSDSAPDYAIYTLDANGIVTDWNLGAQRFMGYTRDEIIGQPFSRFFTKEDRRDGEPERVLRLAAREGRFEAEGWRVRKDGTQFWATAVLETVQDDSGQLVGFIKFTRDITERRKNEERLHWLAHYDHLTELPNRVFLRETLDEAIKSSPSVTVLMMDLDGFKDVNDTLGHAAGDSVLKAAGARIKACLGSRGTVGRLGGDEFAVVVPGLSDPLLASGLCEELIDGFRAPFEWEHQDSYLGLSVGIALGPAHGNCAEDLLSNADLGLYRAKAERRNGYCLFQPSYRQAALARRRCDHELRQAVAKDQLELFYQPVVRLADYCVVGVEALLRWRHPQHGLIAPGAFLDVLERGKLAPVVGDWVIQEAAAMARRIHELGPMTFRMSINLLGTQLRGGKLTSTVIRALDENALPPEALELEITENIFLQHGEAMIKPLRELREFGVGIAFDDYGTGFASLSLLKRFPLTRLKIDQSFVHDLCGNAEDAAVVRAIVYLAESFGLEVTAEGVEREDQRKRLRELGCENAQGFLFGRPMSEARVMQLMHGCNHNGLARWPRCTNIPTRPTALRA